MRVSTSQIYNIADVGMRNAQTAVNKTSEQISTGKRVLSPADDPVAATSILRLNQNLGRLEQYEKNIDSAKNSLNQEEVALESIVNLIQRMKELSVQAGNTGVLTKEDYKSIAAEIDSRVEELLQLQNTRNASGQYIFAGHQGGTQPFTAEGGGRFSYRGDEGQMQVQVSETVSVPVGDSGKKLFVDIPSGHSTFNTRASTDNQSHPPAKISTGQVINQEAYEAFYPRDMKVTFNAPDNISPAGPNYTITDDTGRVLVENAQYTEGDPIELNGIRFNITGQPYAGEPATPATLDFGAVAGNDFTGAPQTLALRVGGKTETLVLDRPITDATDLAAALNSSNFITPGSGAERNAEKLANLGLTVDATGFTAANGQNMTVFNGSASIDAVTGLATQGAGTTSTDGELAEGGDSFLVESSNKQGLLTTLSRLSEAMKAVENTEQSKSELGDIIGRAMVNLDNSLSNVSSVQGELGARQNTLESARAVNEESKLYSKELLSDVENLDYAEASTRLQMESMVLSAAQQTFVKVSGLSLFNYL